MLVFTEGLDETAIQWVKKGSEIGSQEQQRSPIATPPKPDFKFPLDPVYNTRASAYFSPKLNLQSKYSSSIYYSDNDEESVGSVSYTDDSANRDDEDEEEVVSSESNGSSLNSVNGPVNSVNRPVYSINIPVYSVNVPGYTARGNGGLVRGKSKENLRVDLGPILNNPIDDYVPPSAPPSAPPILGTGDVMFSDGADQEFLPDMEIHKEEKLVNEHCTSTEQNYIETNTTQFPSAQNARQSELAAQVPAYTTSVQNAWESIVAYESCNRLCLNAYNRGCMQVSEFLQDDCFLLRNAFGIQKYLLQPKGQNVYNNKDKYEKEASCSIKGRKIIEKIEVEVKKVKIESQKSRLRSANSLRNIYAQVGYEYLKNMTKLVKNQINQINQISSRSSFYSAASTVSPEEMHECLLGLKSDPKSTTKVLYPGSGDTHCFYPENKEDAICLEVQNYNGTILGRTTIAISSLSDNNGQIVMWCPLSLDDFCCVGKVQVSFNIFTSSENTAFSKMVQGAPAVETQIYDIVLETAMRVQNFNAKNLLIKDPWNLLLNEFSTFYDVSESYKTLRYLLHVMQVAVPTKGCLDLVHDLLVPVLIANTEQKLTRQEKSILIDCEEKIKKLLAKTFENYKSLDEFSLTGLTEGFGQSQIVDQAGPALAPAVRLFSLLHDVLSPDAQDLLRQYLQNAIEKRCRRHMLETEEFVSCDTLLTDTISSSTAYLKMKNLCIILSKEIEADIKIHNQHIFLSSVDLPKIAASVYSSELCKKIRRFLTACPPSRPYHYVLQLLISAIDFEKDLINWNLRSVNGLIARELFDGYVVNWIEDTRLHLLDLCKTQLPYTDEPSKAPVSPYVEHIYDQISDAINEYEIVIKRWPHYLVLLENVVADVERNVIKLLEKQYRESLAPLKEGIQKTLENNVKKIGNTINGIFSPNPNQEISSTETLSPQLGTFMNTLKRIMDVLHDDVEKMMKPWAHRINDQIAPFGEHSHSINVMLIKRYKKYRQSIVKKLIDKTNMSRTTKLKIILEETKESESETEIRERMHPLSLQVSRSIQKLNKIFCTAIFIDMCRDFWDRFGQIVLKFLETKKDGTSYKGSSIALEIMEVVFTSEMQRFVGNALQEVHLNPPRSVSDARSILC